MEPDSPEHEAKVAEEARTVELEDGRYGLRPAESTPIPNRADNAWEDLLALREEARAVGIEVDESWPINRLQREIARKRPT